EFPHAAVAETGPLLRRESRALRLSRHHVYPFHLAHPPLSRPDRAPHTERSAARLSREDGRRSTGRDVATRRYRVEAGLRPAWTGRSPVPTRQGLYSFPRGPAAIALVQAPRPRRASTRAQTSRRPDSARRTSRHC